jgi:serine protease Do
MSNRRTGFAQVIQIDCPVEPEDCGTVIVNPEGELIGLTIARRSREATLVLPMQRVMELIDRSN